jgi:ABC-type Fe3+/spermidine/putrescine transport system ATPase subunit
MLKRSDRICWIADGRIEKVAQPSEINFDSDEFDEH